MRAGGDSRAGAAGVALTSAEAARCGGGSPHPPIRGGRFTRRGGGGEGRAGWLESALWAVRPACHGSGNRHQTGGIDGGRHGGNRRGPSNTKETACSRATYTIPDAADPVPPHATLFGRVRSTTKKPWPLRRGAARDASARSPGGRVRQEAEPVAVASRGMPTWGTPRSTSSTDPPSSSVRGPDGGQVTQLAAMAE